MKTKTKLATLLSAALTCLAPPNLFCAPEPTPLIHAHAHNDYEHTRPLLDALDQGFCSVEADIYLVDGKLLVAHERSQAKPGRTLEALYLDPLRNRVKTNGGRVYPGGPEFTLLIDLKTDWHSIYPVLLETLKSYSDVLTTLEGSTRRTNAITAIISGSRALKMFDGEKLRYAAYDGSLAEEESQEPPNLIPWISASWYSSFKWRGSGEMPDDEKEKLKSIIAKAHRHGRQVRFWGAPDNVTFWRELRANGVDLINTDDLKGVREFLTGAGR